MRDFEIAIARWVRVGKQLSDLAVARLARERTPYRLTASGEWRMVTGSLCARRVTGAGCLNRVTGSTCARGFRVGSGVDVDAPSSA
jgi:hypothetical protein